MFNLVRGLRQEIEVDPEMASVLLPLKERAERILKDLEDRTTDGLAAMDRLAALAAEKAAAMKAARQSGLSPRAFGVHWGAEGRSKSAIRQHFLVETSAGSGRTSEAVSQRRGQCR